MPLKKAKKPSHARIEARHGMNIKDSKHLAPGAIKGAGSNEKGLAYLRAAHSPNKSYRNGSACFVEAAQPAKGARPGIEVD